MSFSLRDYSSYRVADMLLDKLLENEDAKYEYGGEKTFVYFAYSLNAIKIGVAWNPEQRLNSIQTGNPNKVFIFYKYQCCNKAEAISCECFLHRFFSDYRKNGEWFEPGPVAHFLLMLMNEGIGIKEFRDMCDKDFVAENFSAFGKMSDDVRAAESVFRMEYNRRLSDESEEKCKDEND